MKTKLENWIARPKNRKILLAFQVPKTPKQVEKEFGLKKLKTKPLLKNGLIECLNPDARKGRLYVLTNSARMVIGLPTINHFEKLDSNLIGWIYASPKQRLALLRTLGIDLVHRTSESLRIRAVPWPPGGARPFSSQDYRFHVLGLA